MIKNFPLIFTCVVLLLNSLSSCKKEESDKEYSYAKIIEKTYPIDGSDSIAYGCLPSIKFFYKVGIALSHYTQDAERVITRKVVIDYIRVFENEKEINIIQKWHPSQDSVSLVPDTPLSLNSKIKIEIRAHWEFMENKLWVIPDLTKFEDAVTCYDMCKISTTEIEKDNVEYSYPLQNQYHYLKNEYPKGFLKIKIPQKELFEVKSGSNAAFKVRISDKNGYKYENVFTYNENQKLVEYVMPTNLANEKIYKIELIKSSNMQESTIYAYYFRTSKFNSFLEKAIPLSTYYNLYREYIGPFVHYLNSYYDNLGEYFDEYELIPLIGLLRFELGTDCRYYTEFAYPSLYQYLDRIKVDFNRNKISTEDVTSMIGDYYLKKYNYNLKSDIQNPPLNSFAITQVKDGVLLTNEMILNDNAPAIPNSLLSIKMFIAKIVEFDYFTSRNWVSNQYYNKEVPSWASDFLSSDLKFKPLSKGDYPVKIKYTLPNGVVTSIKEIVLTNPVGW